MPGDESLRCGCGAEATYLDRTTNAMVCMPCAERRGELYALLGYAVMRLREAGLSPADMRTVFDSTVLAPNPPELGLPDLEALADTRWGLAT